MAIIEMAISFIADLGVGAAKKHYKQAKEGASIRKALMDYLSQQKIDNYYCSQEEEMDFEALAAYIQNELMDDVELRLFGTNQERRIARETIADKAAHYAHAKTKLSEEKAKHIVVSAVDMLRDFFRNKADSSIKVIAADIEDTVIVEIKNQGETLTSKIDSLEEKIWGYR